MAGLEDEGLLDSELEDEGPGDPPENPVSQPGDLWTLGEHRLLCGDSRDHAALNRVLDGERADLLWTDPPYGVDYEGKTADALRIENDGAEGLQALLTATLGLARDRCRPGAVWYVAAPAGPQFLEFARVLTGLGIWRQTLVWMKDQFVLGHSDFHYRHEAVLYGWVPGAEHQRPSERSHDTVWEHDRPRRSTEHPTSKPVELVTHALGLSSRPGELVLDPFLGSGTTMIAAEQLRRRCRAIELDPRYVSSEGDSDTSDGSDTSGAPMAGRARTECPEPQLWDTRGGGGDQRGDAGPKRESRPRSVGSVGSVGGAPGSARNGDSEPTLGERASDETPSADDWGWV